MTYLSNASQFKKKKSKIKRRRKKEINKRRLISVKLKAN